MGLRLQNRIRLFKGLTLNLSKTGTSFTLGGRGASVNIRGDKVTGNVGIPGTGISYRERLDRGPNEHKEQPVDEVVSAPFNGWKILAVLLLILVVYLSFKL